MDRLLNKAFVPMRTLVSNHKKRLITDKYNLDLSFITPRIIAMGIVSEGFTSSYRNDIDEVADFFNTMYPDNYMIINLSEKKYDYSKFNDNVLEFGWLDHHPPPLDLLLKIVDTIHSWLSASDTHVVAVHCKAGLGRTGTVICSYLMYTNAFDTSMEAIEYFGEKRSKKAHGVHHPSQIRYIKFAEGVYKSVIKDPSQAFLIEKVMVRTIPSGGSKSLEPYFEIENNGIIVWRWMDGKEDIYNKETQRYKRVDSGTQISRYSSISPGISIELANGGVPVVNDVTVRLYSTKNKKINSLILRTTFNTAFIGTSKKLTELGAMKVIKSLDEKNCYRLVFGRMDCDVLEKKYKKYDESFKLIIKVKKTNKEPLSDPKNDLVKYLYERGKSKKEQQT